MTTSNLALAAAPDWFSRWTFWIARRRLGWVPAPLRVLARSPWSLAATGAYELALERASSLPARLCDLVTLKVAMEVGCRYCVDLGAALASKRGVSEADVVALLDVEHAREFDALDRDALRYAVAMTRTPAAAVPETVARLRDALGDRAFVELTAAIAWENHRARMNHAFGIEPEGATRRLCVPPRAERSTK